MQLKGYKHVVFGVAAFSLMAITSREAFSQQLRGVWVDAMHAGFKSTAEIDNLVTRAAQGRYNCIFAEVMAYQDQGSSSHGAYWASSIVPRATDCGGFDNLQYLCTKAAQYGLQVHAWIVPFRASTSWPPNGNSTLVAHPEWFCTSLEAMNVTPPTPVDDICMLDPGSPDVQEYIVSIVRELATNYAIDGINFDYIRHYSKNSGYPISSTYEESSLKRFQRIYNYSGTPGNDLSTWSDFRRRCIGEVVKRCRAELASITSPTGRPIRLSACLYATGGAPTSFENSAAYKNVLQDWRLWMEMGWLDTSMPMNYKEQGCDEGGMFTGWVDAMVNWKYNRQTVTGQANYQNTFSGSLEQMTYATNKAGLSGISNYSYYATRLASDPAVCHDSWAIDWSWYSYIANNLYTSTAAVPTMPWRDPDLATEGTIWGRVLDYLDSPPTPVDNATVTIGSRSTTTDANGYYVVTMLPATKAGTSYTISTTSSVGNATRANSLAKAGTVTWYTISLNAPSTWIALSPTSFVHSTPAGDNITSTDSFTVRNAGGWDMNYTVSDNASWLACTPTEGASSGETDTVNISYSTASLSVGTYTGTISIISPEAANSPQTVQVYLSVTAPVVPGDFNSDGDVDMEDWGIFQACLSGKQPTTLSTGCMRVDFDGDSDVDGNDMVVFRGCLTAAGVVGDPDCDN